MHSRQIPTQSVTTPENQLMTIQLANFLFEFFPLFSSHACERRSDLLDAVVPTESDVEVTDYHGI